MLGGIVATFFMLAPFVSLLLAVAILIGMISLAVAGKVESMQESGATLTVPQLEKAA
jgi:hypothetical protein